MAGSDPPAAAFTLAALLIVRLPAPRSPTISSPVEFQVDPVPSTVTDAASPEPPEMSSGEPRPVTLAPSLISSVPAPNRPTVA
jgi:hypothetical protein